MSAPSQVLAVTKSNPISRRTFFTLLSALGVSSPLLTNLIRAEETGASTITEADIKIAEKLIGLSFTDQDRTVMLADLNDRLKGYAKLRALPLKNAVPPALVFSPLLPTMKVASEKQQFRATSIRSFKLPKTETELAFLPVLHLAHLLRTRQISSEDLTRFYLAQLKKYDPILHCVITLTEDLALRQAKAADAEMRAGHTRGLLHGIPWGAKDLLAVKGYPTTWGTPPYKNQQFDENAAVVDRLEKAGAVLVAKLSMGELAWGDVWFGAKTRNPWNPEQGSSGSSAGSAAATAAGLVGFAIGTETYGSIVSPSTRCGTTGLRPTFGRVSRTGAMALSWSLDKIGTICRTAEDCAVVFQAIHGSDGKDATAVDYPFYWNPRRDLRSLRIGFVESAFAEDSPSKPIDQKTLTTLQSLGFTLKSVELPSYPAEEMMIILEAEAAAAFDEITRNRQIDLMTRQGKDTWPTSFRCARFIPAVEYVQANRIRTLAMQQMAELFNAVDIIVSPSFGSTTLPLTNLTGHPAVVLPNGFQEDGTPVGITFIGNLFKESDLLAVAKFYQDATDFHLQHPPLVK